MKKLVSGVLVLLTVAAGAFFVLKVRRFVPERSRALELAPAETIVFLHAPNLRETAKRFQKTGLFAIWQEPEVQEFMQKPRQTAPPVRQWEERLARLARVAPGEAFLAVTSLDGPQPRFVAGFSFAGKRREVEALLAEPRGLAIRKGPAIEAVALAECYVRNWFFVASDEALLRATLARYENPSSAAAGALAGDEIFQKATAPLGSGPEVMLFARRAALGKLMPAVGRPANQKDAPEGVQAIAASTRIESAQMRDTVFVLSPREADEPPLSRSTLALGGPETFLYFASGISSLARLPESVSLLATALPGVAAMEKALAERTLEWSDFGRAFGPEIGTTVEWPSQALTPVLLLAAEVRDPAKARDFIAAVTGGAGGAPAWAQREDSGILYYSAPVEGLTLTNPTIALTPRFALLGFSVEAVAAGVGRINATDAGTAADSPFQESAKRMTGSAAGFGYVDAAALFERAYRTLRPALAMSLAFSEELGDYIDAGRLPSAQTISKHLTPSVFSQSTTQSGILMESIGTLTFNQLVLGTIASASAAFSTAKPVVEVPDRHDPRLAEPAAKPAVAGEILDPRAASPESSARREASSGKEAESALPVRL